MRHLPKILVTGADGQLGQCLKQVASTYPQYVFLFENRASLDITRKEKVQDFFSEHRPDFCINTAAYTAVDKAETEPETARKINVEGVKNLVSTCLLHHTVLVQISTDYVFDGKQNTPYKETDPPNPINVYGQTKWEAEQWITQHLKKFYIVRASWLYSPYRNNFVKTMLRLAREKSEIKVVNDQVGTPTHGVLLADTLLKIINAAIPYGCYHYGHQGQTTWWGFAHEVLQNQEKKVKLTPVLTSEFSAPAPRPLYSVLDHSLLQKHLTFDNPDWQAALKNLVIFNNA